MQAQRLLPVLMWNLMPLLSPKVAGAAGWAVVGALEGAAPEEAGEPGIVYVRVVCKPEAVGMDDMRYAFRFGNDKQVNGTNKRQSQGEGPASSYTIPETSEWHRP